MLHIKDTEYYKKKGFPHGCSPTRFYPATQTIFWYAITPTGRISKWWEAIHYKNKVENKTLERDVENVNHIKLPKGYSWSKPILLYPI